MDHLHGQLTSPPPWYTVRSMSGVIHQMGCHWVPGDKLHGKERSRGEDRTQLTQTDMELRYRLETAASRSAHPSPPALLPSRTRSRRHPSSPASGQPEGIEHRRCCPWTAYCCLTGRTGLLLLRVSKVICLEAGGYLPSSAWDAVVFPEKSFCQAVAMKERRLIV